MKSNALFTAGIIILIIWLIVACLSPIIAPFDPIEQNYANRLKPPTSEHICGTDNFGRDIFSRILYGSRISILTSILIVLASLLFGSIYGGIAGFVGGITDDIMMRIAELVLSFPPLILAMVIAAALGPSLFNSMLAMSIIWWPNYARMMRSLVLGVKENLYVEAAEVLGASKRRILFKDIFPNCMGSMVVLCTLDLGNAILVFSGLSFLGLGSPPPTPEWGLMVSDGATNFYYWWMAMFPGLAIFSVAIAANFFGDGLRDFLDKTSKDGLITIRRRFQMIRAIIKTAGLGEIGIRLYPEYAPDTVSSFCKCVREGFYDGLLWFRCQEGYVIQSGSPDNNINTDSDFHLKGEFRENGVNNPLNNVRGALGLGRDTDPDTAGTQFYIVHQNLPHLDGKYCVFGTMLYGFEVLDAIACRETRGKESWYYPLNPPMIERMQILMDKNDELPPLRLLP